ncbi:MAG: hypothetical protein Q7R95_03215, partial [bacterium]|nr:hypothetical protein [bacterium]
MINPPNEPTTEPIKTLSPENKQIIENRFQAQISNLRKDAEIFPKQVLQILAKADSLSEPTLHDNITSSKSEVLESTFTSISHTLSIQEAAIALTRFTRENQNQTGILYVDSAITCLSSNLDRRKKSDEPFILSPEETEAIAGFIGGLQEMLPRIKTKGGQKAESYLISSLHSLLNKHKELAPLATNLVGDLLQSGFSDNLDAAFSIVRDTLPIQEA